MDGLPSGTVTFVFTDIEGSTALLKQLGDRYEDVLDEHRRIVRDTFARMNGIEIDTQGDAFFFAFARARDAVEAAVDAQRGHAATIWPMARPCASAWASTPASRRSASEGYLGLDVVRAARTAPRRRADVGSPRRRGSCVGSSLPDGVTVSLLGQRR